MSNRNRDDDKSQKLDYPPYSRIFVVCNKQTTQDDLRKPFQEFGEIEDLFMPYDKRTEGSKGVAFIKYAKTSSAAAAIEALNQKILPTTGKNVKVMVAVNKYEDPHHDNEFKYKRLFIKVSKEATTEEILDHFSKFGKVQSVYLLKDKNTDTCKGFAYVLFQSFLEAARAFEGCDSIFKPVFATPKDPQSTTHELKRSRNSNDEYTMYSSNSSITRDQYPHQVQPSSYGHQTNFTLKTTCKPQGYDSVLVLCQPPVPQRCIHQLFNVIPGMIRCHYTTDGYSNSCKTTITYDDETSAAHAVEHLNDYEFPSGEVLIVEPFNNPLQKAANNLTNIVDHFKNSLESGNSDLAQLADAIAQASSLIKNAAVGKMGGQAIESNDYCNVKLPPPQPLAASNSVAVKRCFIVCRPHPPPLSVLKDLFSRFGDLIEVTVLHRKNYGYVKYASVKAANDAIQTLHGAIISGIYLKVLVADEKPTESTTELDGSESKRIRLAEEI